MRAKSDIIAYLESQLSDDVWKKLRNSLLGRELLAFGAEVISENENVKDTMLLQMNPETADKNGLYMLSQMNEIPITNIKPSTLVVQMADTVKTYAPYELQYNVGNVHFTNIEYTMQGKSVSLINGTHKCYSVPNGSSISEGAIEDGSETFFYDGTTTYSGIKLGNAYPDSIVVTDENGLEIPRYSSDIALSNNIDMMYKVVTGVDGNTFVRFLKGDDTIPNPTAYKIDWLDHSAMEFEVDDTSVTDPNIAGDDKTVATIEYYSQGVVDDLDYMRQQLKKEMAKYNGLNTPVSVENYVKGMPYILDAKCEKGDDGLCVYVKPSSPTQDDSMYLDFSEVAAHISLNSILFPNIKVKSANQIMFGVEISGVSDLKLQQGIKSLLQERFAYENMNFNTVINTGSILSEIYGKYGIVPTINMTIKEQFVQNKPLSFTPIKNSLKLYDVNDSVVAWEENDLLYGKIESKSKIPFMNFEIVGSMGTMFILMYRGNISSSNKKSINGITGGSEEKPLYESEISYTKQGYNKFYLYDVSTNTIKLFDGCMQNLLYSDSNPCLKYNAWNTDEQSFGNLYDFNILSTNNAFVVQMVFKNSGAEATGQGEFVDWNNKDDNSYLYENYWNGNFVTYEVKEDYQGKYQTTFFIKNPLALKNYNSDSWNVFQDAVHGDPNELQGLYSGLRNITDDKTQLNVKSNWFVHNSKSYYAYDILDDQIYITNGAKNMAITINGTFLGMMPYENDLYVVNPKYVTKVIGFEGLKEKEEIYQIYKDSSTPITITQIIREFDNQIAFKTVDGSYYTATGFEIIGGNKMGFKNLKEIKPSNGVTIDFDCELGGCTEDYVTFYKEIEIMNGNETEKGYKFFCYEITTSKVTVYEKKTTATTPTGDESNTTYGFYKDNLANYWSNDSSKQNEIGVLQNHGGDLFYYNQNGTPNYSVNLNNVFLIRTYNLNSPTTFDYSLYLDNVNINNKICAVPLYIKHRNNVNEQLIDNFSEQNSKRGDWNRCAFTDSGNEDYDSTVQFFYKICFNMFDVYKASNYRTSFNNDNPKSTSISKEGDIIKTTEIYTTLEEKSVYYSPAEGGTERTSEDVWYTTGVSSSIMQTDTNGLGFHIINDVYKDRTNNTSYGALVRYPNVGKIQVYNSGYSDMNNAYYHVSYKLNLVFLTKTVTQTTESGYVIVSQTGEEEISTIGYYDTDNNSIVNDRGTETSYIRYNTQNPNLTSGSYLMLDESEIKFI